MKYQWPIMKANNEIINRNEKYRKSMAKRNGAAKIIEMAKAKENK
jgi:hypothetical protein